MPPHYADQQPLYENLLYGAPTLTDARVRNYFKDATFGVPAGEVESTIEPRPGTTIIRDTAYGVPHIYGETRADTMFGAGYAGAARPPLPDGRPAPHGPRRTGLLPRRLQRRSRRLAVGVRSLHRSRPRKAARRGAEALRRRRPAGGRRRRAPTSKGSTPTSPPPTLNPALKPGEYTLLDKPMEPWKPTDVIAIASLIGGIFGRGGGNELNSALTMQAFVDRFGREGRAQGLARLPLEERPRSADDDLQALPVRDPTAPSPSGAWRCPTRAGSPNRPIATASSAARRRRPEHRRRGSARDLARGRPRLELGAGLRQALGRRPSDRGDGAAGRLLRARRS